MESLLPTTTEVCIVGAGPSGLSCALGLTAQQIPFIIVDQVECGHNGSRALGLYAGSLEAIAALDPQLTEELVAKGIQGQRMAAFDQSEKSVFSIHFSRLSAYTKYPYVLLMPQHEVEQRMRQSLHRRGHNVFYRKRVCDVKQVTGGHRYRLQFESGEAITARYVVGADGANSSVRSLAGISFIDPYTNKVATPGQNDSSFVVADVLLSDPANTVPSDGIHIKISDEGLVLTAPIPDSSLCTNDSAQKLTRLYVGTTQIPPRYPDMAYLQRILDARGPGSRSTPPNVPRIAQVLDSARYRTRPALADGFMRVSEGGAYILLIGDAAHMQGPGGGQGMNLGVCDGCELAQAIHRHRIADSDSDARVLEEYSERRRVVAREVVDLAQGITTFEAGGSGFLPYLRVAAMWAIFKVPFMNERIAWKISGLGRRNPINV